MSSATGSPDVPPLVGDSPPVTEKLRLGGMALRNGLLVHGPTHWAVAIRDRSGTVRVASGRKPRTTAVDSVPGLRGLARMGEAMAVIPLAKAKLPAARLPFESLPVAVISCRNVV